MTLLLIILIIKREREAMCCALCSHIGLILLTALSGASQKQVAKTVAPDPEPGYDVSAETDTPVAIETVREISTGPLKGQHLFGQSQKSTVDVYLAPTEFLKYIELPFHSGQRVHVIGVRTKVGGLDVILAREIRWEGSSLTLRDKRGEAIWKSWMPRK